MEIVVYDNSIVRQHPLYNNYGDFLNTVSERDYKGRNYFNPDIECLDMDTYETKECSGRKDCTVDAVIGIASCVNKRKSRLRLLLVELRMNYRKAENLSFSKLTEKVRHTRQLLGYDLPIDSKSVFVFTEKVAYGVERMLKDKQFESEETHHFVVCSIEYFDKRIRSYDSLTYVPKNNPETITRQLRELADAEQWPKLFAQMGYWRNRMARLKHTETDEYNSLSITIATFWCALRKRHPVFANDDNEIEALIIDEFVETLNISPQNKQP